MADGPVAHARAAAFKTCFYAGSVLLVLATPITAALGHKALLANVHLWCRFHRLCARVLLGVRSRFEGAPPRGIWLYAAKHHAMYETLELALVLGDPVIVVKRELARIPLWGWALRRYGAIVVDRDASATALRAMMAQARAAHAAGRAVLIFPEGTRVAEGARPPLRSGFAGLYRAFGAPVVPVAINSGGPFPRKGPARAGVVTFRFGAPIPPGLDRREIDARVHEAINVLEP